MDYIEVSGKTVDEALTNALVKLETTSDKVEYEVVSKGSSGFLGIGAKPAVIKARKKSDSKVQNTIKASETKQVDIKEEAEKLVKNVSENVEKTKVSEKIVENQAVKTETKVEVMSHEEIERRIRTFLADMFKAMDMKVEVKINFNEKDECVDVELLGDNMGVLIGKRGQTLDSLQYLTNLVVNKGEYAYMNVTIDTENYRVRRKETLEHLAFNLAKKAKHNRRNVTLEPMNPYERRIIHATLQNDRYVTTYSEGVEPFRYVVIALKNNYSSRKRYNNRPQERNNTTETTEE